MYGAEVSVPSLVVPLKKSTLAIVPSESVASASIATDEPAENVVLLAGLVIFTVGRAFAFPTLIDTAVEVLTPFSLSVARAVSA